MNIISCHEFVKYEKSTVIFSCFIKLVYCYPLRGFFILEKHLSDLRDVPLHVKQIMDPEILHMNDSLMA